MAKKTKVIYSIYFTATGALAYMDRKPTEEDLKAIVWKNEWYDDSWKDVREQIHVTRCTVMEPKSIKIKSPRPKHLT